MALRWAASRRIEFDENGERASGAIAYFWLAGTDTPLTVYQDASLSTPHDQDDSGGLSGSSKADSIGRWPEVWIPYSATPYRERVVTASGTLLWDTDDIIRTDPVTAAEDTVDATQLMQTGDMVWRIADETRSGFVRANGRTIGSASSGATERANADAEELFLFYWNKTSNSQLAVSGGRGASAAADWAANKTIALPDLRGGQLIGLDTMGNSAGSFLASTSFAGGGNGNSSTPGSLVAANTYTIVTANLPAYTPAGSVTMAGSITFPSASRSVSVNAVTGNVGAGSAHLHSVTGYLTSTGGGNTGPIVTTAGQNSQSFNTASENNHTHTFTGDAGTGSFNQNTLTATWAQGVTSFTGTAQGGTATPHNIVSRSILATCYIKL